MPGWMRYSCFLGLLLLLVLGACSDMGAGFFAGQVPLPGGDLFIGCPKLDDTKALPDLGNGASTEAGASHFSFSVSSIGEANLSVPIAIPPGRAGMEPSLSVTYSSAGDEGYLGFGFSLSGFSSITRCPKNLADDGEIDPVRDDASDAFCMDGVRLIEVAPNEFRTVPDTFARIVASSNASGPQSFTVHAKSGLIYQYASESSAKVFVNKNGIRTWLISKISDRHGNAIRFKYINDRDPVQFHTREFAPQRIDYTDHPDAPASRSVQFVYQAQPPREVFARGMKLQRSLQLDKIQTFVNSNSLVREYRFSYSTSPNTQRRLLSSIQECAADQACKPATRFSYHHGQQGTGFEELNTNLPEPSSERASLMTLDATGDGLDDLLIVEEDPQSLNGAIDKTLWRLLANKSQEIAPAFFDTSSDLWLEQHVDDHPSPIQPELGTPIDYDHDGRMDILLHDIRGQFSTWHVLLSRGSLAPELLDTGITRVFAPNSAPPLHLNSANESAHLADIDGDGMGDLIQCVYTGITYEWNIHVWTPQGWDSALVPIDTLIDHPCNIPFVPSDIDADGQLDILVPEAFAGQGALIFGTQFDAISFEQTTNSWSRKETKLDLPQAGGRMVFVDMNADGLPDALQSGFSDAQLRLYINSGNGFLAPVNAIANAVPALDQFFHIAAPIDFNNDGRQDLLLAIQGALPTPEWKILQSNGKRFDIVDAGIPFEPLLTQSGVTLGSPHGPRVTDLNGDGVHDLVLSVAKHIRVYKNKLHSEEDRLATVSDGMNPWDEGDPNLKPNVSIAYDHLIDLHGTGNPNIHPDQRTYISKYNIADGECAYPIRCVLSPKRVVSTYSLYQGGTETHDFRIAYRNGRYDRLGRGFLGFSLVTTRDLDTKAGSAVYYDNLSFDPIFKTYPFARKPIREIHWNPSPHVDPVLELFPMEVGFGSNWLEVSPTNNGKSYFTLSLWRTERRDQVFTLQNDALQLEYLARDTEINPGDTIAESYRYVLDWDEFGNILKERATTSDQSERTLVTREFDNNTQDWLIGLVTKETTCSESNGVEQCQFVARDYDAKGKLYSEYTADEAESQSTKLSLSLGRDAFGNVIRTTLVDEYKNTRSSCVTFDIEGIFPWATSNGANLVDYYRYDPGLGVLKAHEDPNGLITTWKVDGFGRTLEEERPDGTITTHTITRTQDNGQWNLKLKTQTPGHEDDTVQLDSMSRVIKSWTQRPQGVGQQAQPRIMQMIEYDALGERMIKSSLPSDENTPIANLHVDQYEYDGMGRLVKQIAPWGAVTKYRYLGRMIEITAPGGVITLIENDLLGRPSGLWESIKPGLYSYTTYQYGPFQSLRSVTHPNGSQTVFERDALGRVVQLSDPDRGLLILQYNGFDELTHSEDALGRTVDLWYDNIGRLKFRKDGDGLSQWIYDQKPNGKGSLGEVISPAGHKAEHSFDAFGRLIKSTREIDGESFSLGLNYDAYSRVQSIQYPGAFSVEREYDPHGYLQRIKKGAEPIWQRLGSDGAGRTIYEQFGAHVSTVREYWHDKNRLKHIHTSTASEVYQELEYDYDERLNLSFRKDLLQGKTEFFFYDQRDRITDACLLPNAWLPCLKVAEYDAQGNILSKLDVGVYKYEQNRPNTLEEAGGQAFVHDAVGNLRDKPGAHLDYTAFDLPKKVSIPNDELTFDYDGHQQRIRKRSLTKETVYFDQLYERVTDSLTGELRHHYYIYNDERLVSVFSESNLTGNDIRYIHTDHLGSTDVITDAQGQITERQSFGVFGVRRNPKWGSGPLQSGPAEVSRGFTGHEGDDELGLIHMRGRLMDPRLGRFITPDPLISNPQLAQGWNPFVYALNSPLSDIDPSGLSVVTAEPETAKLSPGCQCYEVTVRGPPRQGQPGLPKAVIQEQNEMQAQPPTVDLGTGGLPAGQGAPSPVDSERIDGPAEHSFGENAANAGLGIGDGIGELLWETAKSAMLHAGTLGLYSPFRFGWDVGRGLYDAWQSGNWAGLADTAILSFNKYFNPLYGIMASGYGAYIAGKAGNWREAFKLGTIATVLTVLAAVTAGKGLAGAAKKGTGAAGIGAAEEAGTKAAASAGPGKPLKTYQTYTKPDLNGGPPYVGRTSGKGMPLENVKMRDRGHHMNNKGYGPADLIDSSPNKAAIRGQEQRLIDRSGGAKSQGGTSGNAINGIDPNNPKRQFYMDEAKKEFGP